MGGGGCVVGRKGINLSGILRSQLFAHVRLVTFSDLCFWKIGARD